jgi:hypothetical protein
LIAKDFTIFVRLFPIGYISTGANVIDCARDSDVFHFFQAMIATLRTGKVHHAFSPGTGRLRGLGHDGVGKLQTMFGKHLRYKVEADAGIVLVFGNDFIKNSLDSFLVQTFGFLKEGPDTGEGRVLPDFTIGPYFNADGSGTKVDATGIFPVGGIVQATFAVADFQANVSPFLPIGGERDQMFKFHIRFLSSC